LWMAIFWFNATTHHIGVRSWIVVRTHTRYQLWQLPPLPRSPSPSYAHFISNMKNMSPFSLAAQPANETRFPNYGFLFPSYECAHIFISRSCQQ
jgi:hypothetical protein